MKQILIVDDEQTIREVVALYLKRDGFEVNHATTGPEAITAVTARPPDLIILDVMLPGFDGFEVLRRIRNDLRSDVPVIMLTARGQEIERILGLEAGADDYVTKPFSPQEVVARAKAILRRMGKAEEETAVDKPIVLTDLEVDPKYHRVVVRGDEIKLTATEFNLLLFLVNHPGQVFSRDQLLEKVWGFNEYVDPSTVTVHMRRLREKLEVDPGNPHWLQTIWGVGYKFVVNDKG